MTRAELNSLALAAQGYIEAVGSPDGPDARDWFFKECSPESILWMRQRIERLEAALRHAVNRDHPEKDWCSGCTDARAALAESAAPARGERGET